MKVIKRDGRLQDFNIKKIMISLEISSDEIGQPLNNSDIDNIARDIFLEIESRKIDNIPSVVIRDIVTKQLSKYGFVEIAKHYNEYTK